MTEPDRVPISKRLVLINSASSIATRLLTLTVFAWAIQYLMKRIPEEELALLPIVMSVALVLPVLQTVLAGGLARFVTEAYARDDLAGVTRIVSSQFPLLLACGLGVMLVGSIVVWNIHHILTIPPELVGETRLMMLLVLCQMCIGIILAPFDTGLFAQQRFVLQNLIRIGGSMVRIGLMLVLILGVGPRVVWVVASLVGAHLFVQVVSSAVSMYLLPALRYRPTSFDWATCKQVLSFGGWNFVIDSANLIRRAADAPILNVLSTPIAVNDFFLGSLFETQLRQLAITASQPLMPALTAMHAHQQSGRLAAAYLRGGRLALWASMFLAVPLIVFSYDLFSLYLGSKYAEHVDAATVMIILLLGFPLTYPTMMLHRIAFARGDLRPIAIRSITAQLGNLALTFLLVGPLQMGAIGSAIATLFAFAVVNPFFYWRLAIRMLDLSWRRFFSESLLPGLLPAIVAGCAGYVCALVIAPATFRLVVGVPVCLVAYAITMTIVLRPADRADLNRIRKAVRA